MDIPIGLEVKRAEIHQRYQGSSRNGICSAPNASAVFLFTDSKKGKLHGYRDGWGTDGCFHYNGDGQTGDQIFIRGNRIVLEHAQRGLKLHLFESTRPTFVRYVGEFALAEDRPWYPLEGIDKEGRERRLIIFRLIPVGETLPPSDNRIVTPRFAVTTEFIPLERHLTDKIAVESGRGPYAVERRESRLVEQLRAHLEHKGHEVMRNKIIPAGEVRPLYTDLHDKTTNLLVEAKGSVTRERIRSAIGQLLDYHRYLDPRPKLAVLVPDRPRPDLLDLCASVNIATIWPQESGQFRAHSPFALSL
jgi:hypothetical protein